MNIVKEFSIDCEKTWFDLIANGTKTVEGRKRSPTWKDIKVGDILIFCCEDEKCKMVVTGINYYLSLNDYLVNETLERALPGVKTIKDGEDVYSKWWSVDEITRFGIMGIQIKKS